MKKIIIGLTIFSFLNMIGCYYQEQMNPNDYIFDENNKVTITTKDTTYSVKGEDYYYQNDTLVFTVKTKLDQQSIFKTIENIPV